MTENARVISKENGLNMERMESNDSERKGKYLSCSNTEIAAGVASARPGMVFIYNELHNKKTRETWS